MSTIIHEPRYTIEQAEYGWDVIDSQTGESVGVCPDEKSAASRAQQLSALHFGNVKRLAGATFKAELHALGNLAGAERLATLLEAPTENLASIPLRAALLAVHGIGRTKAGSFVRAAGVSDAGRRVGDLSPRQRALIASLLRSWACSGARAA